MKPAPETNTATWINHQWQGSPTITTCAAKYFINPHTNRKVPVFVWHDGITRCMYTVSAGSNSEYSYTGSLDTHDFEKAKEMVDAIYKDKKLFK